MSHTVYLITNTVTGRVYVGMTDDPARRFSHHMNGNSRVPGLAPDIRRHGKGRFTFEILCVCETRDAAFSAEAKAIEELDAYNPAMGYNRRPSGGAGPGNTNARARSVRQLTMGGSLVATYRSVKQASEATGISRTAINRILNGRSQYTAGGYRWSK